MILGDSDDESQGEPEEGGVPRGDSDESDAHSSGAPAVEPIEASSPRSPRAASAGNI